MALQRLHGEDFEHQHNSMVEILCNVRVDMVILLPEIRFKYLGLPYLFAWFKLHKLKYCWITSATKCSFSSLANMITHALKLIYFNSELGVESRKKIVFNLHRKRLLFVG